MATVRTRRILPLVCLVVGLINNGLVQAGEPLVAGQTPKDMQSFLARISSLKQSKSWSTIKEEATAWMASHPRDASAFATLATSRIANRSDPESLHTAEYILREALVMDPNSVRVLNFLGMFAQDSRRHAEAVELYRRLLKIDPNHVVGLNNLAWNLVEQSQDYEQALALTARALTLAPTYTDLLDTHGIICFHLQRFEEAEKSLKEAVRLMPAASPGLTATRYHLAQVYEAVGRNEEATDLFQRSLNLHDGIGGLSPEEAAHAREFLGHQATTAKSQGGSDTPAVCVEPSASTQMQIGDSPGSEHLPAVGLSIPLNDSKLYGSFQTGLMQLVESNGTTANDTLVTQLRRNHHSLTLPETATKKMSIISRHFVVDHNGKEVAWIAATTDIAPGSSGAPLLNEYGQVVGIASQTQPIQPARPEDHQPAFQMMLGQFVPAASILKLIRDEPGTAANTDHPYRS